MCLIFISIKENPTYKLIVAANRDEFYDRKTAPAHFWEDHPHVLGGRDLEAMGTWMGINKRGRISMITNYRAPANIKPQAPSRGQLVSDYLTEQHTSKEYMQQVVEKGKAYNGFNLVVGDSDELVYYSNYKNDVELIGQGTHGLSNHLLNTPWPKLSRGIQKMKPLLSSNNVQAHDLLDALYDVELASDAELPDTGIGLERERILSSMFIKSPNYGSRCSTIIMVDYVNQVFFTERVYDTDTFKYTEQMHTFVIEK